MHYFPWHNEHVFFWIIFLFQIMNRLHIVVLVSALLIVSSYGRPKNMFTKQRSPKVCMLVCYRRMEHCDSLCTTRFGEGRLGENLYYYKNCLEDCAITYVDCISECWHFYHATDNSSTPQNWDQTPLNSVVLWMYRVDHPFPTK